MGSSLHQRCPFYPESCRLERHRMPFHEWVVGKDVVTNIVTNAVSVTNRQGAKADVRLRSPPPDRIRDEASSPPKTVAERQAASRAGRKAEYNARQRELMAKRRAGKVVEKKG